MVMFWNIFLSDELKDTVMYIYQSIDGTKNVLITFTSVDGKDYPSVFNMLPDALKKTVTLFDVEVDAFNICIYDIFLLHRHIIYIYQEEAVFSMSQTF